MFEQLQAFCLFIGCARSGTSILGALLDAHPHVIIAHELHVLKYIQDGVTTRRIYQLILENSHKCASDGRVFNGYSYAVPNQWQGKFRTLRVLGDKKAGASTAMLGKHPELLQRLQSEINFPVKLIHVVRNPFDTISTQYLRRARRQSVSVQDCARRYLLRCEAIVDITQRVNSDDVIVLRHESFIGDPVACLERLCRFVGIECPADYARDCTSIVFHRPHRSRDDIEWRFEDIEFVKVAMRSFPFLEGYTYEDGECEKR